MELVKNLSNPFFVLSVMLIAHYLADFVLQTEADRNMKQKIWWKRMTNLKPPKELAEKYGFNNIRLWFFYCNDYKAVLAAHSLFWGFLVSLPCFLVGWVDGITFFLESIVMAVFHFRIDDEKANEYEITLVEDQLYHLAQIVILWAVGYLFPIVQGVLK